MSHNKVRDLERDLLGSLLDGINSLTKKLNNQKKWLKILSSQNEFRLSQRPQHF